MAPRLRHLPSGPLRSDLLTALAAAVLLAACSSTPRDSAPSPAGPPRPVVPKVEPLLRGGPNKPYAINGRMYFPLTEDLPLEEQGIASWYGKDFHGRRTAMGEVFNMHALTAAHKTMPLPSYARVRNLANGRELIVRVNDRGPFVSGRVIDLSWASAQALGIKGVAKVSVERLTADAIRRGAWPTQGGSDQAVPTAQTAKRGEPEVAGLWLQWGAFRSPAAAQSQGEALAGHLAPGQRVRIVESGGWHRVRLGPYADENQAQEAAQQLGRVTGASGEVLLIREQS